MLGLVGLGEVKSLPLPVSLNKTPHQQTKACRISDEVRAAGTNAAVSFLASSVVADQGACIEAHDHPNTKTSA